MAFPGWSPRETARRAHRNPDVVRNMARRRHDIDQPLAEWLERIAEQWMRLPPAAQAVARTLGCDKGSLEAALIQTKEWQPLLQALNSFHQILDPPAPVGAVRPKNNTDGPQDNR